MENKETRAATILIVDDLEYNIELLTEMLRDCYNIISANSGLKALEILRADPQGVDAVLLDIVMPEMNGYEVLFELSRDEKLCTVPVIVITSDDDSESQNRAFELGAVDFVPRHSDIASLRHRVKTVLKLCEMDKIRVENELLRSEVRSERHLRALMDNLPGGVAVIETDGKTASCGYFNSRIPPLFKMTAERFAAQFSAEEHPAWIKSFIIEARHDNKFSYIFSIEDESGAQWIRMIASALRENENTRELYCVFLDINSEKRQEALTKKAEQKLRDNEIQLETLINNSPGGISLSERDENGRLRTIYISPGLAEILGYPDYETAMGIILSNSTAGVEADDADTIRAEIRKAYESGERVKCAFQCKTYDNQTKWLMLSGQFRAADNGNIRFYSFITNITKEKEYEEELCNIAYYDPLTGCYNRAAFIRAAGFMLKKYPEREFLCFKFNVGNFKVINDLLGRDTGDEVLKIIAAAIEEELDDGSVFARYFADQFVIMLPYSERSIHPQTLIVAVQSAVAKSCVISGDIQCYIGVYKISDKTLSIENMVDRASIACRAVTGSFREHVAYYDEKMRLRMLEEQRFCDECYRALKNHEFCVYYQAIYGIKAKKLVSAEALVRWKHPTEGLISPARFIPVFEKNGFIAELDLYVAEQVCVYHKKRRDLGLPAFPVSVNISRASLYGSKLYDAIEHLIVKYGIEPKYLRIEITESAYNENAAMVLNTVKKLRRRGFPVLMDDFGSGYSSLNTLKDIPFDILKLDMKFMEGFEKNGKVGIIVTSIARMAKWLNIPLLAEGVETAAQVEFLESVGCAYIQGYYFARPLPEEDFTKEISENAVTGEEAGKIEDYKMGGEINELFGGNSLVSKLIGSVFGGLGIYELGPDSLEVVRVNEEYGKIMGYEPGENYIDENTNVWEYMHPDDVEISRAACLEAVKTDKPVRAVCRRYNKNNELIYLDSIHRRLGGTDEKPIICIALFDVTDKYLGKNAEKASDEELRRIERDRNDNLLRKTVRHLPVGLAIFRFEEEGPVPVYFSEKMYAILGASKNINIFDTKSAAKFVDQYHVAAGTSGEHVFSYTRPDGRHIWLKAIYRALQEGDNTLVYAVMSDISDHIEEQKREAVREQTYDVLIEESGTVIFNYAPDTDELSYYHNTETGGREYITLERVTESSECFTILYEQDRKPFVEMLKKLSDKEDRGTMYVRMLIDGYPRRYKATIKSITDSDGVVFRIIGKLEDIDDEMTRLEEIQSRAMFDSLCVDVYNKPTTEELIRAELSRSTTGALMMIDIDDFKGINDSLGHIFGDEFLKIFATTVKGLFRETDIVGRYGGDEFFVFMPHATAALSERKGNQLLEKIAAINIPQLESIKSSIGISVVKPDNRDYRQLLKQADSALYQAKNRGKNCVVVFDPLSMNETTFRAAEAVANGRKEVALSANPAGAATLSMRVFSALYSGADFENGINKALELVGNHFDVSRVYIFEDSDDGLYCSNTFEWCSEGVEPEKQNLQNLSYAEDLGGNYHKNFNDEGLFYCHDINELDESQKEILSPQNIKSMLQCAITDEGVFRGFIGFDECRGNRFWTQEQIDSLVFLAKVLSTFLIKNRYNIRVNNYARSMNSILDDYPCYLYIVDSEDMKILYLNKHAKELIKTSGDCVGKKCSEVFCGAGNGEFCPVRKLKETGKGLTANIFSPTANSNVKLRSVEVSWNGQKAYLVIVEPTE